MTKLSLIFSPEMRKRITEDLATLDKSSAGQKNIAAFASTLHHETGELAFVLGYAALETRPNVILAETSEGVIAFHMPSEELICFQNSRLDWVDGYIIGYGETVDKALR